MKRVISIALAGAVSVGLAATAQAQGKSLSSTMEVYVFPTEGQDTSQQSKDEAECYEWAVGNAGVDPESHTLLSNPAVDIPGRFLPANRIQVGQVDLLQLPAIE